MSAWLCSDNHVAVLALAIKDNVSGYRGADTQTVAQMLHDENIASLAARYGADERKSRREVSGSIPAQYFQLHPLAIVKLIHCYQYQACEHAGWKESEACKATEAAERVIVSRLVEKECGDKYWGIE
jgi:hypothetical protein